MPVENLGKLFKGDSKFVEVLCCMPDEHTSGCPYNGTGVCDLPDHYVCTVKVVGDTASGKVKYYIKVYPPNSRFTGEGRATTAAKKVIDDYLRKKGYYKTRALAIDNKDTVDSCVLLNTYDESRVEYPCILSPKIDGIRCRFNKGVPLTRGGKEITSLPFDTIGCWDGELFIKGEPLEVIQGAVTRDRVDNRLKYHIFDCLNKPGDGYIRRLLTLSEYNFGTPSIHKVPYKIVRNKEEADEYYEWALTEGYEGVVYRSLTAPYECKRTWNVVKRKPFDEGEFRILHVLRDTEDLILFEVANDEGSTKSFKVVPDWPDEVRCLQEFSLSGQLCAPRDLLGKYLTVKYQGRSTKGVPKFAVGKVIRETKGNAKVIL